MEHNKNKNQTLPKWLFMVAFVVPIAFIVITLIVVNYPNWTMKFDYDFVYATCDSFNTSVKSSHGQIGSIRCRSFLNQRYTVVDGILNVSDYYEVPYGIFRIHDDQIFPANDLSSSLGVSLFVHDTKANKSTEIEPEYLEDTTIISTEHAPDGTQLVSRWVRNTLDPFFFGGGSSYSVNKLERGNASKEMDVRFNVEGSQFHKVGWIER